MNASVFATKSPVTVMPWGKHKGRPLKEIPEDYLRWALNNADSMRPDLRQAIQETLGMAPEQCQDAPADPANDNLRKSWEAAVKSLKEAQAEIRKLKGELASSTTIRMSDGDVFRRILKQWFGAMSRKFHPDLGGSAEKQAVLNLCYQDLSRRLEGCNGKSS